MRYQARKQWYSLSQSSVVDMLQAGEVLLALFVGRASTLTAVILLLSSRFFCSWSQKLEADCYFAHCLTMATVALFSSVESLAPFSLDLFWTNCEYTRIAPVTLIIILDSNLLSSKQNYL